MCAGEIDKLERVQGVTTTSVLEMRPLNFPKWLDSLRLFLLQSLRMQGDLTETLKVPREIVVVDPIEFVSLYESKDLIVNSLLWRNRESAPLSSNIYLLPKW